MCRRLAASLLLATLTLIGCNIPVDLVEANATPPVQGSDNYLVGFPFEKVDFARYDRVYGGTIGVLNPGDSISLYLVLEYPTRRDTARTVDWSVLVLPSGEAMLLNRPDIASIESRPNGRGVLVARRPVDRVFVNARASTGQSASTVRAIYRDGNGSVWVQIVIE